MATSSQRTSSRASNDRGAGPERRGQGAGSGWRGGAFQLQSANRRREAGPKR